MNRKIKVGILIFDEVEVLDFTGPFEVFSISESTQNNMKLFDAFTVSEKNELISTRNGLQIYPKYTFNDCPDVDILIVPGGYGAEEIEIHNQKLLNWLVSMEKKVKTIASVCTGAFLLAESGILEKHQVTTHWMDVERLRNNYPKLNVIENVRYVDQGKILTSAGISAGIELSLYLVMKYCGLKTAKTTAKRMDYQWDFFNVT